MKEIKQIQSLTKNTRKKNKKKMIEMDINTSSTEAV